ncbi:carbohydrate kinase [Microbacterium saccharophilum]|uniref:Carbohydrate kinase n=1 Tax=Microbacterium saccharophilum TaxID=1213358 RepID=A0A5C8I4A9_9MICO|nr:carbohydrate kinase [Microbacterium saccharophilum]TXK13907.1 carbohydrate kinase [Microbacterium saccharophilum]GEP48958.1 fructokinase [Microbacterium saccharophilum]
MTGGVPSVVVIGESLVDIVHRGGRVDETPGGSPANVALTLGRLERRVSLVTALGDDARGQTVRSWLADSGVDVWAERVDRTATATATLDDEGAATYDFDLTWNLPATSEVVEASGIRTAALVHIGSVAAVLEPGASDTADIVSRVRPTATITFDPTIRPALVDDASDVLRNVRTLVSNADIVKASDEDLRWLHPERDVLDVAREWQRIGPALVVVTYGAGGAVGVTAHLTVKVPSVPTAVVDTVGAGDTFMGALIDGILAIDGGTGNLRGSREIDADELEALLTRCGRAAAITVSRPGADPPRLAELDTEVG